MILKIFVMKKILKIIGYLPAYVKRFFDNLNYYIRAEPTYSAISERSSEESLYPIVYSWWVGDGHYKEQNNAGIPIKFHIDGVVYSWSRICNYALYNFNEYKITGEKYHLDIF